MRKHYYIILFAYATFFHGSFVFAAEVTTPYAIKQYEIYIDSKNKENVDKSIILQSLLVSAEEGYDKAEFELGMVYVLAKYNIVQDYRKANEWLLKSAKKITLMHN